MDIKRCDSNPNGVEVLRAFVRSDRLSFLCEGGMVIGGVLVGINTIPEKVGWVRLELEKQTQDKKTRIALNYSPAERWGEYLGHLNDD